MTPLSEAEVRDLLPAYALGALDADDRRAIDDALAHYPSLAAELAELRRVTVAIADAGAVTPPPSLRNRVLDRIAHEAKTSGEDAASRSVVAPPPHTASVARDASPAGAPRTGTPVLQFVLPAVLGLALAASLVVLVRTRNEVSALRADVTAQSQQIVARDSALRERDERLAMLLDAEQSLLVVNLSTPESAGPGMQFFWNRRTGRGMLHAYRLPPAPPGRTYQLWLIKDGTPVPVQLFNSDPSGRGVVSGITLPTSAAGVSVVAVTEEPAGGSPLPTTAPFLVGTVRGSE